eukprot:jgi/Chrzof1/5647/Cz16g10040.t1
MMATLPAGSRLLVEFRAGKLMLEGKMLKPDTRKGLLRVIRTEDGLVHLQWLERTEAGLSTAEPENDVILFPGEATFEKAPRTSQRVYHLKFANEADRNKVFWMQGASEDADDELAAKVDKAINSPLEMEVDAVGPPEGQDDLHGSILSTDALMRGHISTAPGAGAEVVGGPTAGYVPQGPGQEPPGVADVDISAAHQLAQLLSGMAQGGAAGTATSQSAGSSNDPGASLAAALVAALAQQQQQQQRGQAPAGPSLAEVLQPEALAPLLQDPEVVSRLAPYLPEEHRSPESLRDLARSPQFQQQLHTFSTALQTGQLDLAQFGLQARGFSVADFLAAIQELVDRERQQRQQ